MYKRKLCKFLRSILKLSNYQVFGRYINTFASQHIVFTEKIEQLFLENASNLTHEIFFVKIVLQNICVKFDAVSRRYGSFFPQNRGTDKL